MLYIFDKDENLLEILNEDDFFNDMYKRQINKEWSFYFETKVNKSINLKRKSKVGFYDKDNVFQLFEIDEVEDDISFDDDTKAISTLHDYYRLGNKIVVDKRVVEGSCRDALEKALEGTDYKPGNVAELGLNTLNFYYITSLEAINKIVAAYGGELNFRFEMNSDNTAIVNRYVDIINRHGEDSGVRYTLDTNLLNIKRNEISEGHYTVLYGRGASLETDGGGHSRLLDFANVAWSKPNHPADKPLGEKYIEDVDAIEKYGRIEGVYENKDITDPAMLLQYTWDSLQTVKEQKYNYSAKVEDISSIKGYEHFKVNLGDTIIILDEEYNLNEEARIIEERYPITDMNDTYIEMGHFMPGITDIEPSLPGGGSVGDGGGDKPEIDMDNFPDTLPQVPVVNTKGGFAAIALDWSYENKLYYDYEVYASELENFHPDPTNLIFRGKASVLLHEVKPSQTWYYRVRAINSHGRYTEYSNQVSASTKKLSDAAQYFEEAAIADALIGNLRLDRGWVGHLDATYLNVKGKLIVTDGNGKRTLYIDSFGNVIIDAAKINMKAEDVRIAWNNINDSISLRSDELAMFGAGSGSGKRLSLKRGLLNTYRDNDNGFLGYYGMDRTYSKYYGTTNLGSYYSWFYGIAQDLGMDHDTDLSLAKKYFMYVSFADHESYKKGTHIVEAPLYIWKNIQMRNNNIYEMGNIYFSADTWSRVSKMGNGGVLIEGDPEVQIGIRTGGKFQPAIQLLSSYPNVIYMHRDIDMQGCKLLNVGASVTIYENNDSNNILLDKDYATAKDNVIEVESEKAILDLINTNIALEKDNKSLVEEQKVQNDKIATSMIANTELFELILGLMPTKLNVERESDFKMIEVYVTLIIDGYKTLDEVPKIIRPKVNERLVQLGIPGYKL